MNTAYQKKLFDRKDKERKTSLQWVFSSNANDTQVHHISDRRDVSVWTTNQKNTAEPGKHHTGDDSDGLLGSLLLGQLSGTFFTAMLGHLLPSAAASADLSTMLDMADTFWMDRRKPAAPHPEASYFPY